MNAYYAAAVHALGRLADDPRASVHVHSDWIDFGRIADDPSWSSGELAVISFARTLYTADGFVGNLTAVDPSTRNRLLESLDLLLGSLVT